ncbi:NAD(+) diphosphatase [Cohaesibacter sp. CAU 1516]|uniref:NAD(+) diphosphatase n=1 Tax=Cohaesibacter sp. CAU 1516 TaxID=2576038 RepID=UPI0010FD2A4F|nr:NAD(+) diphosphatase [Cohaesibacter sp. CAU 1516]TLP45972.1 NAD(+) diphosphatase [Cohaesibacter sp. CAU 1516]
MSDFFAGPRHNPSFEGLGYAHNRLDRDTEHRTEATLKDRMAHDRARFYLFDGDRLLVRVKPDRFDPLYCQKMASELGADMDRVILLGTDPVEDNAPRLAAPLLPERAAAYEEHADYQLETVRAVGLKDMLPADQLGAVAQARSLLNWHDTHQYCAKCGAKTHVALAGARRDCPSCEAVHFPRTDPVVIMLAIHRDAEGVERCLLARHTRFEDPMFSTLAGFMEQGETLEDAVRREIFEEAGVRIGAVRYLASQPWPFPSSLMLGCFAEALSTDLTLDDTELGEAHWYSREALKVMMERPVGSPEPHVPGGFSIAHWLIKEWAEADPA